MAQPISFTPPLRDARAELVHRLQKAPEAHVEALLDAYSILQLLHDKGILELVKGALGSGEKILQILTETMEADEIVRTVRNLVIFMKILGSIDPETLEKIMHTLNRSVDDSKTKNPPGLVRLLGQLSSRESRRALEPIAATLESAGRHLPAASSKKPRKKTTRHA